MAAIISVMCHAGHDNGLASSHVVSRDYARVRCSDCGSVVVVVAAVAAVPASAAALAAAPAMLVTMVAKGISPIACRTYED